MTEPLQGNRAPDFRVLFESAPGLYLVLAPDLTIVAVSEAYLLATMTRREDILGRGLFDVFPDNPDDPAASGVHNLKASLERVRSTRASDTMAVQKYDIRRPESEGGGFEERFWSPVNSPVLDAAGGIAYIIHRVEDVTEFVRLRQRGSEQEKLTQELRTQTEKMAAEVYLRAQEADATDQPHHYVNATGILAVFGVIAVAMLAVGRKDYPNLHTVLDTSMSLLSAVLALSFWDKGRRTRRPLSKGLAVCFAVAAILELIHVLVVLEWSGPLDAIAQAASVWRPTTWPPAAYILPLGVAWSVWLMRRNERRTLGFALALIALSTVLFAVFRWLPRYTSPTLLGITRPTLILVPVLWAIVGTACWRLRGSNRLLPTLASMSAVLFLAHVSMLYSQAPHDTQAMVAHLGKVAGYLLLLLAVMKMASSDMLERIRAQRALARLSEELERRVLDRTAQFESANQALEKAYDDLRQTQQAVMQQERLRALGQMASGIAHDINNALSPVALYTESLLEREPGLSERGRERLTTIQHAVESVGETVARMREFYRAREPQLQLAPVELNDLVQQVIDLTRARWHDQLQQRGIVIDLKTDLSASLPPISGAENEIRDALTNLIFNAVDAMPEGGTLTLKTTPLPVRSVADGTVTQVILEVIDTGVGMDENTRQRCLEPFFTTKGEQGTGLGLAMVYGMVQRHSADLEIDSQPGRGTTIRIIFPISIPAAAAPGRDEASAVPILPLRILVVDDDPLVMQSLRDTLQSDGHRVVTADGGQAGVDAFLAAQKRNEPFDVAITDLGMPYVDGRKVAATLRAASPTTPIVLLTGWGQRLIEERDVPPEVNAVLSKPPKLPQLRATLIEVTAKAASDGKDSE